MFCWRRFCNNDREDKKILIEFFKNSTDKIINQMEIYYSKTYNTEFKLTNRELTNRELCNENYHYTLINNDNTQKLVVEGKLIKNNFTYKLIIYNAIRINIININDNKY
jgi:hypothetical protein